MGVHLWPQIEARGSPPKPLDASTRAPALTRPQRTTKVPIRRASSERTRCTRHACESLSAVAANADNRRRSPQRPALRIRMRPRGRSNRWRGISGASPLPTEEYAASAPIRIEVGMDSPACSGDSFGTKRRATCNTCAPALSCMSSATCEGSLAARLRIRHRLVRDKSFSRHPSPG